MEALRHYPSLDHKTNWNEQTDLIIDDEEDIRRITRLTLQVAGHDVGEARDGERGLTEHFKEISDEDLDGDRRIK